MRSRFLVECAALVLPAVDCPCSYADNEGAKSAMQRCQDPGCQSWAIAHVQFAPVVNRWLEPPAADLARRMIHDFDQARSPSGGKRVPAAVADGFLA